MNAIVYTATHSIGDWVSGVWNKLSITVNRIGYARAAGELRRLGYYKEAEYCLEQMRKL
jgi:hypothetical protein